MRRAAALLAVLVLAALPAAGRAAAPPGGLDPARAAQLQALMADYGAALDAGRFGRGVEVARQILDRQRRWLGEKHWTVTETRLKVERMEALRKLPRDRHASFARAWLLNSSAKVAQAERRFAEAERLFRDSLALWRESAGENHAETAIACDDLALVLEAQGKFAQARPLHLKAVAICEKELGREHPVTGTCYCSLGLSLYREGKHAQARPYLKRSLDICRRALGEEHPETASAYNNLAMCLKGEADYAGARPLFEKALAIARRARGDRHPSTATSCHNLANVLSLTGEHERARRLDEEGLAVRRAALGEDHPLTGSSYNNLAMCLQHQGRYAEARPLLEKALAIALAAYGERHPEAAVGYNNLGTNLDLLGRHAEARPLLEKALAIRRGVLGERHPDTGQSYNNLASNLKAQGMVVEATALAARGLEVWRAALGEDHPEVAVACNNLALLMEKLGKLDQARELCEEALSIRRRRLGDAHPKTAQSLAHLAALLGDCGDLERARAMHEEALARRRKKLSEGHPDLATAHDALGLCLNRQEKYAQARPHHEKALAIRRAALGEDHPDTARGYTQLGLTLWREGRCREAVRLWQLSCRGQEAARWQRADSGFGRAQASAGTASAHALLAVGLAGLNQPRNAFAHAELSLARGLLDDLASPDRADAARALALRARLEKLDEALVAFAGRDDLPAAQRARRDEALREHRATSSALARLAAESSARQVLPLADIQAALPGDAALVLWVDAGHLRESWGCVVRREGPPRWERLVGTGQGGTWTRDDRELAATTYALLREPAVDPTGLDKRLAALAAQRLGPLRPHLKGVRRLFVVPSEVMAYVPAELLDERLTVSYVPSGSVLARQARRHRAVGGASLLALGDPAFERAPPPEPPGSGVLVRSVVAGSPASKAGLRAGDVLLSVGSVRVGSYEDLNDALSSLPAKVTYWRDGKTYSARVPGGPLGAAFDRRSALAAWRAAQKEGEAVRRGTGHRRLPGTRAEAGAIAALVKGSTLLLGSDASEQRLDELRQRGELRKYRLLHFATHGQVVAGMPGHSALILAQDRLPDPAEQARRGRRVYDGRLTVSRIRAEAERGGWELDADLVVLSACETGLGLRAGGDGLLGFAQAFLSRGARSVVLSRWKVDDTATALLMVRFYENLLGSRKGTKPMGRAAALDEAKKWLRTLPRKETERLAALHSGGALRGSEGDQKPPEKARPVELKGERPYAHPFYWAAFTLVGDPD